MDADDISLPDRFEKQIELMENGNLDICGGHYQSINSSGNLVSLNLTPQSHEVCTLSLISKVPFAHPTVMIKREFLDKHSLRYGQSNYEKAEDLDMWIQIHKKGGKFGNVDDIILKYRIIENSLSKVNDKKIRIETKDMLNQFYLMNKNFINQILSQNHKSLNIEEESLIIRAIYKIYLKKFRLDKLKDLKKYSKRNVVCTILSEIVNG